MPKGKHILPDEKREQGTLRRVLDLVPLFELILHIIEIILDLWR
jgi:hypothetical protein